MDNEIPITLQNLHSDFPMERFANARILVVDDVLTNIKLITGILTAGGYRNIEPAYDGLGALKATYRFKPELVLLDIMMPHLDGFGYCEQIRGDEGAYRMPIIVQTAMEEREGKRRALTCGADDFLRKPLDPEELLLRVHVHLERYFMYQDMEQMRTTFKQELEQAKEKIKQLEGKSGHDADFDMSSPKAVDPRRHPNIF